MVRAAKSAVAELIHRQRQHHADDEQHELQQQLGQGNERLLSRPPLLHAVTIPGVRRGER
jgi:hypothetical protein